MLSLSNLHLVSEHIPHEKITPHKKSLSKPQPTVKPLWESHIEKDSLNYSTFSTSKIVSLYTNYKLGRNKSAEIISFLQSKIGKHGEIIE